MNFALLCENGFDLHNDEACALAAESLELGAPNSPGALAHEFQDSKA